MRKGFQHRRPLARLPEFLARRRNRCSKIVQEAAIIHIRVSWPSRSADRRSCERPLCSRREQTGACHKNIVVEVVAGQMQPRSFSGIAVSDPDIGAGQCWRNTPKSSPAMLAGRLSIAPEPKRSATTPRINLLSADVLTTGGHSMSSKRIPPSVAAIAADDRTISSRRRWIR